MPASTGWISLLATYRPPIWSALQNWGNENKNRRVFYDLLQPEYAAPWLKPICMADTDDAYALVDLQLVVPRLC